VASEARCSACAARSLVAAKSLFKYSSFTLPIQTKSPVEAAPTINAAIKNQLAKSYSLDAHSSDGHIRMPPWFPLLAIGIILFSGISALIIQTRYILRKQYRNTKTLDEH
jgi:hypothetical protein